MKNPAAFIDIKEYSDHETRVEFINCRMPPGIKGKYILSQYVDYGPYNCNYVYYFQGSLSKSDKNLILAALENPIPSPRNQSHRYKIRSARPMIEYRFKHLTKEERNIMEQMRKSEIYIQIDKIIDHFLKTSNQ